MEVEPTVSCSVRYDAQDTGVIFSLLRAFSPRALSSSSADGGGATGGVDDGLLAVAFEAPSDAVGPSCSVGHPLTRQPIAFHPEGRSARVEGEAVWTITDRS